MLHLLLSFQTTTITSYAATIVSQLLFHYKCFTTTLLRHTYYNYLPLVAMNPVSHWCYRARALKYPEFTTFLLWQRWSHRGAVTDVVVMGPMYARSIAVFRMTITPDAVKMVPLHGSRNKPVPCPVSILS